MNHSLAMIAERYQQEAWIHTFSDGSATNTVANRGAGLLLHFPQGQKATASLAIRKHSSNHIAEKEALMQAASIAQASQIMTESRLSSSLTQSPSCRLIKTTSSQTWPKPHSKYKNGCSSVDSSVLWNIRKWASGCPCEGGFQRTAWHQLQLQQNEDLRLCAHNAKDTEGWLSPAVPGATSCSNEALYHYQTQQTGQSHVLQAVAGVLPTLS